jgi:hypothetical protein
VTQAKEIPIWVNAIGAGYFLGGFFIFGWLTLFYPTMTFPVEGNAAAFPIQFFAVRHIAIAVPLFHGLLAQDPKILRVCFTIFLVMAVLDVILLLIYGYYIPLIGPLPMPQTIGLSILGFIVPNVLVLRKLRSLEG